MLLNRFGRRVTPQRRPVSTAPRKLLSGKDFCRSFVWAAAFFIGIDLLGIDLTALAFFGGAFGLAIGFGLQKTFGNLIAGIILLMDKVDQAGGRHRRGRHGRQTRPSARSARSASARFSVTTRDEREYLIPNENLMINQVENWSYSSRQVRMQVQVGVSYNADMDLAEELMLKAAKQAPRGARHPPRRRCG